MPPPWRYPAVIAFSAALSCPVAELTPAAAREPYRRVLISSSLSMNVDPNLFYRDVTLSRYAVPECPTPWWVRKYQLFGGKQENVHVIWIDNGKLQICLIPTRGMGILSVYMNGARVLGWDSPVREIVHPSFVNLQSRGGRGWLEGFSEWLCRAGLEWNGQPGTDRFLNHLGQETTIDLTLHGRIANLPAQEVELLAEREPPFRIAVRARIDERMMHGPKLELVTELWIEPGSARFQIADAVTNRGTREQEFGLIYHANFGPPLLEEGSQVVAPVSLVTPLTEHSARDVARYDQFDGPTPGFLEQFYGIRLLADRDGQTQVLLRNRSGDRAASFRYSTRELPFLTLWKNTAAPEDGYVVGIAPGTNYPHPRPFERQRGRVPKLAPGASAFMNLEVAIHANAEEVQEVTRAIARIQNGRRPTLLNQPEKNEGGDLPGRSASHPSPPNASRPQGSG
jgi:hypothetical protein